jgi:hypothetical protein
MQGLVQLPKGGEKQLSPVLNESFPSNMCSLKMMTSDVICMEMFSSDGLL